MTQLTRVKAKNQLNKVREIWRLEWDKGLTRDVEILPRGSPLKEILSKGITLRCPV